MAISLLNAGPATLVAQLSDLPYRLVEPGVWELHSESYDVSTLDLPTWYASQGYWWIENESLTASGPNANNPNALSLEFMDGLVTATRASLPGHLLDRAGNRVVVTGETTLTLPAAVAGYARDFLVRLTVSATSAVTWTIAQGESWDTMGAPPASFAAGTYLYHITEVAPGVFHCEDMMALVGLEAALAAINGGVAS